MEPVLKKARIIAIVFGALSGIALIAFVYGFIQHGVARQNQKVVTELAEKLRKCEAGIK